MSCYGLCSARVDVLLVMSCFRFVGFSLDIYQDSVWSFGVLDDKLVSLAQPNYIHMIGSISYGTTQSKQTFSKSN